MGEKITGRLAALRSQAKRRVRLTLTEEMLGTSSADPDIHRRYVASKAPLDELAAEEVAALEPAEGKTTVFPRMEDGTPFMWDYQVKGFFKDACKALWKLKGTESSKLKAYRQAIDGKLFVEPRRIALWMPEDSDEPGSCQRPLRASTPQGERVALAESETVPAGTVLEFSVEALDPALWPAVEEWLEYGQLRGLGQWRNSGKGRFEAEWA